MNVSSVRLRLRVAYRLIPPRLRFRVSQLRAVEGLKKLFDELENRNEADAQTSDSRSMGAIGWRRLEDCSAPLLDPGGAQIGSLLYVICGLEGASRVSDKIRVLDMSTGIWGDNIEVPGDLPHSHCAVASDGARYIYIAGGQLGANCSPAVASVYCFDALNSTWHRLPTLPAPRYAGSMQLWRGRLHFVGGADVDRWTPTANHWSLGVSASEAVDTAWRNDVPIPIGGMHRGSAVVADRFYIFGGQQGDFKAIDGKPPYICTERTQERYLQSAFRLAEPDEDWERLADLPIAASHFDFACLADDQMVYLFGGQIFKHPRDYSLRLTDAIQAYDTETDSWSIAGHLTGHLKTPVVGLFNKQMYVTVGQRGTRHTDRPGTLSAETWAAPVPTAAAHPAPARLQSLAGKSVLLVSHNLTRSGAPLEVLELGRAMIDSGAIVRAVTLADDARSGNLCAEFRIPLVPAETALDHARAADLVIVNSAQNLATGWVRACLNEAPEVLGRIVWMVHEIDVEDCIAAVDYLSQVGAAVFDSAACQKAWGEAGALSGLVTHVVHPGLLEDTLDRAGREKQLFHGATREARARSPQLLSRSEIRAELAVADDDFLVLCVGAFSRRKGQEMLLRSITGAVRERQLPLKLALVGLNSEDERRRLLKSSGRDGVSVLGPERSYLVTPHIDALFLASDAHVLNSQGERGRGETFGRSTVQAMAHGLPVLGTNAGGTPEIIEDGVQGFVYPLGKAGQATMIERLDALVRDPDLRKRMGDQGRARAQSYFRKERYLQSMDEVFRSVLSRP